MSRLNTCANYHFFRFVPFLANVWCMFFKWLDLWPHTNTVWNQNNKEKSFSFYKFAHTTLRIAMWRVFLNFIGAAMILCQLCQSTCHMGGLGKCWRVLCLYNSSTFRAVFQYYCYVWLAPQHTVMFSRISTVRQRGKYNRFMVYFEQ